MIGDEDGICGEECFVYEGRGPGNRLGCLLVLVVLVMAGLLVVVPRLAPARSLELRTDTTTLSRKE